MAHLWEEELVKSSEEGLVLGGTRWRRFALAIAPAAVAAGALLFGMSAGAFPAQFTVSGQEFKVSADRLEGQNFSQLPGWDSTADGTNLPVARSVIEDAELTNLCQSVRMPDDIVGFLFPGVDEIALRIEAGGQGTPVSASNLVIGLTELSGDATFTNMQIGNDAGEISGEGLLAGQFGQRADVIEIDDLQQVAYSTTAGTFTLNDLRLRVMVDSDGECF